MTLTIPIAPEMADRFRMEAAREGVSVEVLAARRLEEAELVHRIVNYFPLTENREMRSLVARRTAGTLTQEQQERLIQLARLREERNAQRHADIIVLASLRGISPRVLMTELGIRPASVV
jgi:hypothetical protein